MIYLQRWEIAVIQEVFGGIKNRAIGEETLAWLCLLIVYFVPTCPLCFSIDLPLCILPPAQFFSTFSMSLFSYICVHILFLQIGIPWLLAVFYFQTLREIQNINQIIINQKKMLLIFILFIYFPFFVKI